MTNLAAYATYREIKSQPDAWEQALEVVAAADLPRGADFGQVIFTGCGSTYYLSLAAAALYQALTGRIARAAPAGELLLNSSTVLARDHRDKTLLVAISRSGTTTETVRAVEQFKREGRGPVVVISNYPEILSERAEYALVIDRGQEVSVAQTRSFASMYVAAVACCAGMAARQDLLQAMRELPAVGTRLMAKYEAQAETIGADLRTDRFYFLGSGLRYGLACEANLKMKEMTLTHSEPFHFLEFRHGPMSMVNREAVVVGLRSEANSPHERKVLAEMRAMGGRVFDLAETNAEVCFDSGLPEDIRGVLYLPVLQLMAFYRSVAKGLDPDRPRNLTAVVKLDF